MTTFKSSTTNDGCWRFETHEVAKQNLKFYKYFVVILYTNKLCRMLVFSQGKGLVSHNNSLGLGSLGSKSPLQSPPNVSVPKDLMSGMHTQLMPNTSHPNQLHSTMPMSSIQGTCYWAKSFYSHLIIYSCKKDKILSSRKHCYMCHVIIIIYFFFL